MGRSRHGGQGQGLGPGTVVNVVTVGAKEAVQVEIGCLWIRSIRKKRSNQVVMITQIRQEIGFVKAEISIGYFPGDRFWFWETYTTETKKRCSPQDAMRVVVG